jgi:hypothetical protein
MRRDQQFAFAADLHAHQALIASISYMTLIEIVMQFCRAYLFALSMSL